MDSSSSGAYFGEDRTTIEKCIESVRSQTVPVDHIVVADGAPQDWIDGYVAQHVRLCRSHGDYGNTPRAIGSTIAIAEAYQAFSFLDADNWLEPDHFEHCLGIAQQGHCDLVIALRQFMRLDGSLMPVRDRNPKVIDTNCFFFLPPVYYAVPRFGQVPKGLSGIGDVVFWQFLRSQLLRARIANKPTVSYLCKCEETYKALGEIPPQDSRSRQTLWDDARRWLWGLTPAQKVVFSRMIGFDIVQVYIPGDFDKQQTLQRHKNR